MFDPEWLSAIANSAVAFTIFLGWKQLKADHERSRREMAVHLTGLWAKHLSQHSTAARKLIDEFTFEQARCLAAQEEFEVPAKYRNLLDAALKESLPVSENGDPYRLSVEQSSTLRWEMVTYLNTLEVILSAWNHKIADRDMIEEQFRYLISPEKDHFILKCFRQAMGGSDSYPAIEQFVAHLKAASTASSAGKAPVA